jgi:hypothetical protein
MKLNEKIEIRIYRTNTNFDKACDAANKTAMINTFHVDAKGHIPGFERSTHEICIKFKSYKCVLGHTGRSWCYSFDTWIQDCDYPLEGT